MKGKIERGFLRFDNGKCACLDCLLGVKHIEDKIRVKYWYTPVDKPKQEELEYIDYDEDLFNNLSKWVVEE